MILQEAGKLLLVASGFDRREVSELNATAWHTALTAYSYGECEAAVVAHFTDQQTRHEYLTVGHVLDRVERSRRIRTADVVVDVRAAKARGLLSKSWPATEPLASDVAERLRAAREADRVSAVSLSIEAS